MSYFSNGEESPLFGEDFSQEWSCDGASPDAIMTVQMIGQSYGCCGENGRPACSVDYSHVCQDPADYLPGHTAMDGEGPSCDSLMSYSSNDEES